MPYITSWERIAEKKGVKIGKQEGVESGKIETARKLIKRGVALDIIAEATGFSKKRLKTCLRLLIKMPPPPFRKLLNLIGGEFGAFWW